MPLRFANPAWYSMLFVRNMSIKIWTHSVIVLARPSVVALIPTASAGRLGVHGTGVLNTVCSTGRFSTSVLVPRCFMFIVHTRRPPMAIGHMPHCIGYTESENIRNVLYFFLPCTVQEPRVPVLVRKYGACCISE
jgi:hypothetical protein